MNGRTKLFRTSHLSFECPVGRWIVRKDLVFIGTFPGIEILLNERANVSRCCLDGWAFHNCSLLDVSSASSLAQAYLGRRLRERSSRIGVPRNWFHLSPSADESFLYWHAGLQLVDGHWKVIHLPVPGI